jgi:trimethylamine--corrinoid protein Co-methyltransferase
MPTPTIALLSQEEKERIYGQSLEVLQKVGIQFNSERALNLLQEAGCEVDRESGSARIPPHLVEQALQNLPSQFLLAARNPAYDIVCGDGQLYYTSAGQCPWFRDLETRERREATLADLVLCAQLTEVMEEVQEWCPMVLPNDVHPAMRALRAMEVTLLHTSKHLLGGAEQRAEVPYLLDCIDAVLGDRAALRERPILSAVINPSSPLKNSGALVDNILDFAPYRVPIFLQFLPLAGATSPITLAGTVLQENTAFLGNLTLFQLAQPGWPIIWAAAAGVMDMRSGRYAGGPEAVLMTLALIEMARFYGVPCNSFGASSSEAFGPGYQNGLETMFGLVVYGALARVDNFWWPADLDGFNLMDLASVVLATEAVRQTGRVRQGMAVDEGRFMLDDIIRLGFRGQYLSERSTRVLFREEHLLPELFPRQTYESWQAQRRSEEEIALDRVRELLGRYEPPAVPREVVQELDRIMTAAEAELLS